MKKLFFLLLLSFSMVCAQEIPSPVSGSYVHDFANVLTPEQRTTLHNRLIELKKKYTIEVAVVTIETTGEYVIDDYSLKLGRKWGVGGKSNNGLLIVTAINDRKWRIEVGYGLEGDLPDATTSSLARDFLVPRFKEKNYFDGFINLINEIDKTIDPVAKEIRRQEEIKREAEYEKTKEQTINVLMWIVGIIIILVLIVLLWQWRIGVLERRRRLLEDARRQFSIKFNKIRELKSLINLIKNLQPDYEELNKVNSIWGKYESFYLEAVGIPNDIEKISEFTKKLESFTDYYEDRSELHKIEQSLVEYRKLKDSPLGYKDIEWDRNTTIKSFDKTLLQYDPGIEDQQKMVEEKHGELFKLMDELEVKFRSTLSSKKNIHEGKKLYNEYKKICEEASSLNRTLNFSIETARVKKTFINNFDEGVSTSLKLLLGVATLHYISKKTREDAENRIEELRKKANGLSKTPENYQTLKDFVDNINKGFENLFKEKEQHEAEERRKQEEERKKREEEERKRRKKREEEEEEERRRRRNDSYSSSSSDYSWSSSSSSSSSSDSYSGGSFGGGGSSGDW